MTCGINAISQNAFSIPASPDRHLYACADGRYVAIACAEVRTWVALCAGLGCEDLAEQLHKWQDMPGTITRLAAIFLTKSAAEWVALLAPAGAAVTVLNHAEQLLDDPHILARGSVVKVADIYVPANPLRLADDGCSTGTVLAPPAMAGADTHAVLGSAGYSPVEITRLEADGVV